MLHARPMRLLIVDDSPDDAEMITAALRRAAIVFESIRIEEEAGLEAALAVPPDAVICDHWMPCLTVARVAELLTARDPDCPLILVSGGLAEAEGTALINGICRDFVSKDALHRLPSALLREIDSAGTRRRMHGTSAVPVNRRVEHITRSLRHAIEHGGLELHYQPQLDMRTGRIVAAEALARWTDPELGSVSPAEFVPIAESSGLALELGSWVIKQATQQLGRWADAGRKDLRLSINLSTCHFARDTGLVEQLGEALSARKLDPRCLRIEITEGTLIENVESASEVMRRIAALGIAFAVDDFGTGYSSLSYLRRFPISEIKIDRSFITDLSSSAENTVIVRTIVAMAHALGTHVVAEGVETAAQFGALRRMGCDLVQGYLVSRPVPVARFDALPQVPSFPGSAQEVSQERTLLIVDDESDIAALLEHQLRSDGYRILSATSAAEGLERLAEEAVGVIISDQGMPVMSGNAFLQRAKTMYPNTVRLVLSGHTDLASVTNAINEGAIYKFITKPWTNHIVRSTVREAFERHELLRDNERLGAQALAANRGLANANAELERRVAQKTSALSRQLAALRISQETLDRMPVGVVGVDAEGMVAAANTYAVRVLGAFPGSQALDCLPTPLLDILGAAASQGGEARGRFEQHTVLCRPMGAASSARGAVSSARGNLLVAIPASI